MALDEVMPADVAAVRRPPTLRIWEWAGSAVVMGRFKSLRNEVDAQAARSHGIKEVRRNRHRDSKIIATGKTITYTTTKTNQRWKNAKETRASREEIHKERQ